ncbi:hypothetical protein PIB30_109064 [Stylosanthes scabra]|uniref:Uncharacterized protein n=1 Tax=Stylosanthes scabra TaxID=79078 RepID=A0ABU6TZ34_9FABA|nr:hypothetical protein [Stylosanthes scabra]
MKNVAKCDTCRPLPSRPGARRGGESWPPGSPWLAVGSKRRALGGEQRRGGWWSSSNLVAGRAFFSPVSRPGDPQATRIVLARPQVRRGYPLSLSISISGGKETNKDSPSNGERTGKSPP